MKHIIGFFKGQSEIVGQIVTTDSNANVRSSSDAPGDLAEWQLPKLSAILLADMGPFSAGPGN